MLSHSFEFNVYEYSEITLFGWSRMFFSVVLSRQSFSASSAWNATTVGNSQPKPLASTMDHLLACYLGMKAISQLRSMKELVLGCCVSRSSFLMLPLWKTRRPWGQGCSACVVFYHVTRWPCWLTRLWKIFSLVLAWKKSIVNQWKEMLLFLSASLKTCNATQIRLS